MTDLALRVQMRCWSYAASIAPSSAGLGARDAASCDATAIHGFVRVRIRLHATRLDSRGEPVARLFDNQRWTYVTGRCEKHHATDYPRWVGPRQGSTHWPPPGWMGVDLSCATWARPAMKTRTDDMSFDPIIELCVVLRSMALTIDLLSRSIRRPSGRGAALRQLCRRWLAPNDY